MDNVKELKDRTLKILVDKIEQANKYYWMKGESLISDQEYDELVEQLRQMDPNHPLLNKIGDGPDEVVFGTKVKHHKRMLSLAKAYTYEDVLKWVRKVSRDKDEVFCVEPKYDGLSCEIYKGKLVTRGDGITGSDCTHIVPFLETVPTFASFEDYVSGLGEMPVYGEILIHKAMFKKLREQFPELAQYKTPRNMAAGLVNTKPDVLHKLLDGKVGGVLSFYNHDGEPSFVPAADMFEKPQNFERWVREIKAKCPCPIDGVVFKLGDLNYRNRFPNTEHHPTWALAYKFKDAEYETIVKSVAWEVGMEAVTPVVKFNPVEIEDPSSGTTVTVSCATAHNAKFIRDNHIVPGTRITIVRRGGVIPKVVAVERDVGIDAYIPTRCPSCGGELVWQGPELVCIDDKCEGKITNKIVKGLDRLGLKGIGPAWVERSVKDFYVTDIIDWCTEACDEKELRAAQYPEYIIRIMTSELKRIMEAGVSDETIFASLCIPGVGTVLPRQILTVTPDFTELLDRGMYLEMQHIPGINKPALEKARCWMLENAARFEVYWNMFTHLRKVLPKVPLKKFCFTGALPMSRLEVSQYVAAHGGEVTENANQADYLVTDNPMSNSSKMQKAKKRGIPVIDYNQLKTLLGG